MQGIEVMGVLEMLCLKHELLYPISKLKNNFKIKLETL